ncbi:glycogen debranching N-terminal domain-containing protein [Streptomyces sp. NPDC048290]|uniref:glycogen debranching N-terminal domain-containing protein n=1 Tax=Streptomyces sp. NPDC048290 TaxID=3155811 RepID=UPI0034224148
MRGLGESTPDPAVALHRRRTIADGRLTEVLEVTNAGVHAVRVRLTVTAGTDLATMEEVKSGRVPDRRAPTASDATGLTWTDGDFTARLTRDPAPDALDPAPDALDPAEGAAPPTPSPTPSRTPPPTTSPPRPAPPGGPPSPPRRPTRTATSSPPRPPARCPGRSPR